MHHVTDLPEQLHRRLAGQDLILFDGLCVLCSGFFRLMLRIDRAERFRFVTAQSDLGQALYTALGMNPAEFETNLVIVDGVIHGRLDAFAAAMRAVGWPWRALAICRFIPEPLKSWMYNRIARNRYAIFGRYDQCVMPDASVKARFMEA